MSPRKKYQPALGPRQEKGPLFVRRAGYKFFTPHAERLPRVNSKAEIERRVRTPFLVVSPKCGWVVKKNWRVSEWLDLARKKVKGSVLGAGKEGVAYGIEVTGPDDQKRSAVLKVFARSAKSTPLNQLETWDRLATFCGIQFPKVYAITHRVMLMERLKDPTASAFLKKHPQLKEEVFRQVARDYEEVLDYELMLARRTKVENTERLLRRMFDKEQADPAKPLFFLKDLSPDNVYVRKTRAGDARESVEGGHRLIYSDQFGQQERYWARKQENQIRFMSQKWGISQKRIMEILREEAPKAYWYHRDLAKK